MKLFVANIERKVTEAEIRAIFETCGQVDSVKIITDRSTGMPKGFGFVEMTSDSDAQKAIDSLHDREVGGRKLAVAQAKPKSSSY